MKINNLAWKLHTGFSGNEPRRPGLFARRASALEGTGNERESDGGGGSLIFSKASCVDSMGAFTDTGGESLDFGEMTASEGFEEFEKVTEGTCSFFLSLFLSGENNDDKILDICGCF